MAHVELFYSFYAYTNKISLFLVIKYNNFVVNGVLFLCIIIINKISLFLAIKYCKFLLNRVLFSYIKSEEFQI